jgi:hypothetical protein
MNWAEMTHCGRSRSQTAVRIPAQDLGAGSEPENVEGLNRFFGQGGRIATDAGKVELDISSNHYQNSILVDTRRCLHAV